MQKEGSKNDPEKHFLDSLYAAYQCAVPKETYKNNQFRYFTHTTRSGHFWDRTLDYLFTNGQWVENSVVTFQEATRESDHAPVGVVFKLPVKGGGN